MPPETKPEEKDLPLSEDVMKVLKEVKDVLGKKGPEEPPTPEIPKPDPAAERSALQKSLGFNDSQMSAYEADQRRKMAPVVESQGWTRLEKRTDIDTYRKDIEKELAIYPPEARTPEIMDKIYFMVKGRHADSRPAAPAGAPAPSAPGSRVRSGPGYNPSEPGMSGGKEETKPDDMQLSEAESFVADKLGISSEEYAKSRNAGKEIRTLRVPDNRQPQSLADIELRRMKGGR